VAPGSPSSATLRIDPECLEEEQPMKRKELRTAAKRRRKGRKHRARGKQR